MPIYEYHCYSCGENFDLLLEESKRYHSCVVCHGNAERVITPTNFHLKGSDWPGKEIKESNEDNRT